MDRLHHEMAGRIDQRQLLLGVAAPEHEYDRIYFRIHPLDDSVGEYFPSSTFMRVRLVSADRQHRIQHENSLLRPGNQKAIVSSFAAIVFTQLFVYVSQRRRRLDTWADTEAEAMCLPGTMVWVLTQQENPCILIGRQLKRREDIFLRRVNRSLLPLICDKGLQLGPVRLLEFRA